MEDGYERDEGDKAEEEDNGDEVLSPHTIPSYPKMRYFLLVGFATASGSKVRDVALYGVVL